MGLVVAAASGLSPVEWVVTGVAVVASAAITHRLLFYHWWWQEGKKQCLDCKSWIPKDAKVCRHCRYRFDSEPGLVSYPSPPRLQWTGPEDQVSYRLGEPLAERGEPLAERIEQTTVDR